MNTMGSGFRWSDESWGRALRCEPLSEVAQHLFTTRQLQLRATNVSAETSPAAVDAAWAQAAAAVGAPADALMRVKQVHGRQVRVLKAGAVDPAAAAARPEADALVSNRAGYRPRCPGRGLRAGADGRRASRGCRRGPRGLARHRGRCHARDGRDDDPRARDGSRRSRGRDWAEHRCVLLHRRRRADRRLPIRRAPPRSSSRAGSAGPRAASCGWICGRRIAISCWLPACRPIASSRRGCARRPTPTPSIPTAPPAPTPAGWRRSSPCLAPRAAPYNSRHGSPADAARFSSPRAQALRRSRSRRRR